MRRPPAAVGDPSPTWPLVHASRRITDDVGACRPFNACKSGRGTRHHAGEDLPAPRLTMVRAPESGVVVVVDPSWYEGTGLLLLQTDTGIVLNLGEIEPGSEREFGIVEGSRVVKGQGVARVGWHDMLHFEAYVDGTRATSQWRLGTAPPATLLDPVPYLRLAASTPATPATPTRPTTPTTPTRPTPAVYIDPEPVVVPPRSGSSSGSSAAPLLAVLAAFALAGSRRRRRAA